MPLDPRSLYARACREALRDGSVSPAERRLLHRLRDWMSIPPEAGKQMEEAAREELGPGTSGGELDPREFLRAVLVEDLGAKPPGEHDWVHLEQLASYLELSGEALRVLVAEVAREHPASLEEQALELASVDVGEIFQGSGVTSVFWILGVATGLLGGSWGLWAVFLQASGRGPSAETWFGGLGVIVLGLFATAWRADSLVGLCWDRPLLRQVLAWSLVYGCLAAFLWSVTGLATAGVPVAGRVLASLIGIPLAAYLFLMPAKGAFDLALSRHSGSRFGRSFGLWEMLFEALLEGED